MAYRMLQENACRAVLSFAFLPLFKSSSEGKEAGKK
jgi:hypothetical protein